ncbi:MULTISPECIES: YwaF family protein [unclassified Brachybacterium]|uniref:YwaF family protein n=1 Tax=unclassified Brachybacterium TaxID=2623841 RepID=UPI0040346111
MPGTGPSQGLLLAGPLGQMPAYGGAHLSALALVVLAAIALVVWARRAHPAVVDRSLRVAGWILLANSVLWTVWGFLPWSWNLDESLPLHFSDALRFIVPLALITRAPWAIVVTYFWGLTLNMQSVLTPDVNYFVWIPLEFTEYWIAHASGVLAPIVLIWGLRFRPTWRGYGVAYAATVAWAAVAVVGNALTGANYGYLNRAPAGPSILDVMGPWPQYLLVEAVAIAVVWALMTWPWSALDARHGTPAVDPGALLCRPVTGRGLRPGAPAPPGATAPGRW